MWSAFRRRVGNNCKRAREAAGLTQAQLADKRRIDRRNITELETGKGDPKLSTLYSYARLLNVPVAALVEDDPEETRRARERMQAAKPLPTGRPRKKRRGHR